MKFKEIIVLLPTLGAIITILIEFVSSYFKTYVKTTFKDVPGEDNIITIINKGILNLILLVDLMFVPIILYGIFSGELVSFQINYADDWVEVILMMGIIFFMIMLPICTYINVRIFANIYKKSLYSNIDIPKKNIIYNKWVIRISIFFWGVIAIDEFNRVVIQNKKPTLMTLGFILYFLIITVISFNLSGEIKRIGYEESILIVLPNETIICKGYLEFSKVYLILSESKERYIMKSEVKSIIKEKKAK